MYALLFCSVLALAVIIERLHFLRNSRFFSIAMIDELKEGLRKGDLDAVAAVGEKYDKQALGRVVQRSVEEVREFDVSFEQALEDCSERELRGINRYMKVLQSIGAIAPLLGLLGTVLGMIMAFEAIAEAAKLQELDKGVVAEGISQALITTATGLIIAIPALISYGFFTSRIDHIISNFEGMLSDMVKMYRKHMPGAA
jgi:biopolymer transport protein ExbB